MSDIDVHEIVRKLIGPIGPIGETNEDDRRHENLKAMTLLVDKLIFDISRLTVHKIRVQYSIKRAGEHSYNFLKELRESLENED